MVERRVREKVKVKRGGDAVVVGVVGGMEGMGGEGMKEANEEIKEGEGGGGGGELVVSEFVTKFWTWKK